MKIQLIGTGSIDSNARSASTIINDEILIDCGNGIVKSFKQDGVSIKNIRVILITHLHGDHTFDLPFFINDLHNYYQELTESVNIYGPKGTINLIEQLYRLAFASDGLEKAREAKIDIHEFTELNDVNVYDNYFVTSKVVNHGTWKPAYGYVLRNEEKAVGFSGDSIYCDAIDEIVKTTDVSILDSAKIAGGGNHQGLDNIKELCKENPTKTIIATHMKDATRKEAEKINMENLIIPTDGYTLEI